MRGSITNVALAMVACVALSVPALAQQAPKPPQGPVRNWGSIFIVAYPDAGTVRDSAAGTNQEEVWNFGSGFGVGAAYARVLGQGLQLGVEGSLAPSVAVDISEPVPTGTTAGGFTTATTRGHAKLGELMATGRVMTGGGGGLGLFLEGGAGMFTWGMPAPVSRWDTDLAFRTAAGLEYNGNARRSLLLEWGQFWAFHQHSGVKTNTVKFSQIRGGIRIGW